jgi:D-glycero-alpha-D-manno-heptose-7-phosphate kinase
LYFTGILRRSAPIASLHEMSIDRKSKNLYEMMDLTSEAFNNLTHEFDLERFAMQVSEGWKLKKDMSDTISNPSIDTIIEVGKKNGALGSKLLGAGGGGMILFIAPPATHKKIRDDLPNLREIDIKFSDIGSCTKVI